jgi:hypothetical protein
MLCSQRGQRVGRQPPEREPPPRPFLRRNPPIARHVGSGPGQLSELADLEQHEIRVGRRGGRTLARIVGDRVQFAFDTFAQLRRSPPVQVPQSLLHPVLTQAGELAEELIAVHPIRWHVR